MPPRRAVKTLTPEFFSRFPLITLPGGAGTTRILDDWLMGQGVTIEHRIECNNWVAIAGMLREGLGVGFLQEGWANGGPRDKPLQVLQSHPPLAPLHYAFQWRRDDIRSLITVMRDLIGEYVNFDEQMAISPQDASKPAGS